MGMKNSYALGYIQRIDIGEAGFEAQDYYLGWGFDFAVDFDFEGGDCCTTVGEENNWCYLLLKC